MGVNATGVARQSLAQQPSGTLAWLVRRVTTLLSASILAALGFLVLGIVVAVFVSSSPSMLASAIGIVFGAIFGIAAVSGSWRAKMIEVHQQNRGKLAS
jgi:hypothetical protein